MSENAIVVENLSKRYLIGHRLSLHKGRTNTPRCATSSDARSAILCARRPTSFADAKWCRETKSRNSGRLGM